MNRVVAFELLTDCLEGVRSMSAAELLVVEGSPIEQTTRGSDGVDYAIEVRAARDPDDASRLVVSGTISEAAWGAPHDRLRESFTVELPKNR